MVLAQASLYSGEWAPWVVVTSVALAVVVVVAAVGVALRSRSQARRDGLPGTALAAVALLLVRVALVVVLLSVPVLGLFHEDGPIDDRVVLRDLGASTVDGGATWEGGPELLLRQTAPLTLCPRPQAGQLVLPFAPLELRGRSNCRTLTDIAAVYGDVEVEGVQLVKQIQPPPSGVGRKVDLLRLVNYLFVLIAGLALERILRLTTQRRPFAPQTVRWLRVLAGGVAGVAIVVPWLTDRLVAGLIEDQFPAAAGLESASAWTVRIAPWCVVLLILVLAEVWRYGVRFQKEAEGVV